jgi:alkylhydroperoxidase/carboxymuconolactone decarboxylase family protein YurZ
MDRAKTLFQWNDAWEETARTKPEFVEAATNLALAPQKTGHLEPKVRAFIQIALNANVTHIAPRYLKQAIQAASDAGATKDEIIEVLFVSSTLSVHGMNADVLMEILSERGVLSADLPLTARQEGIREEYRATRGYWRDFLNDTLRLAPDFLEAYLDFSSAPWRFGSLKPKVREFIYLAFDTSPTHLHMTGLRIHINNALDHGATPEEISEVMALAAVIGLQSLDAGLDIVDALLN